VIQKPCVRVLPTYCSLSSHFGTLPGTLHFTRWSFHPQNLNHRSTRSFSVRSQVTYSSGRGAVAAVFMTKLCNQTGLHELWQHITLGTKSNLEMTLATMTTMMRGATNKLSTRPLPWKNQGLPGCLLDTLAAWYRVGPDFHKDITDTFYVIIWNFFLDTFFFRFRV
jgi:hypothetical protein